MKKIIVLVIAVALLMTGCLDTAEDRAFEVSERKREEREQYWHEQEIYDEAFQAGYEAACEEFCMDGDPQNGGYYEGFKEGYRQYRYDALRDTDTRDDLFYDIFEQYCDGGELADYIDDVYLGWREYMSNGQALK